MMMTMMRKKNKMKTFSPPPPPSQELNDERQFYKQPNLNYELEGQKLRQDIVDKVGHLQTILETAFQVSRERRDLFLSRLLRNTNNRLERAKNRADQILSEVSHWIRFL